ncbi:MAG TPA: hypothetical protein PLG25_08885, partial [bacterium]|nr:hypothetical protein [bacterium]
ALLQRLAAVRGRLSLCADKGGSVPLVQPGDIVFVPAKKFTLKTIFQVLSYAATILTLIFLSKQAGLL